MSNYYSNNSCQTSSVTVGNSIDINLNNPAVCQSSEVRADVVVNEFQAKRIWGRVINCQGQPIGNALAKLVKVVCKDGKEDYMGIAHTVTNCEGFYQFDICAEDLSCYKIIVNKATIGSEVILDTQDGNCKTCTTGYDPCQTASAPMHVTGTPCSCQTQPPCPCPPPVPCPPPMPCPCPPPCPPPMPCPCPPPCPPPMPYPQPQSCGCKSTYAMSNGFTMCK